MACLYGGVHELAQMGTDSDPPDLLRQSSDGPLWRKPRPLRRPESSGRRAHHSTLAPEKMTTFAHFAVSAAMTLPKSCGVPLIGLPPSSARRASILGSSSARFVSALTFSMISAGVPLGIPMPNHAVAS